MSDKKPEGNQPFISQHIGDGSLGASNTIGNVTYNAAPPERHLTSDLRQCLVSSLRQMHSKGQVSFMCVNGDKEGFAFMVELQESSPTLVSQFQTEPRRQCFPALILKDS